MSYWKGKTVLVTGGEGFIGSTLVERLLREGAKVRAFVHYKPYGEKGFLAHLAKDVEMFSGDIRDAFRVSDALKDQEVVFHLAALIAIPYSYESPEAYVQVNVGGTQNILAAAHLHGTSRIIHTSTSETYGTARYVPIDELHPLQPQSPYSASKIGADMMALSYFHTFNTPVVICRPFNTYGPRQSMRAVIPTILQQLQAGVKEIKLGSLTPTRDFTYVDDTVSGFLAVAASNQAIGNVINLGTGNEISIGNLAKLCVEITGSSASILEDSQRLRPNNSEVERLLSDNTRARTWCDWQPQISLREGLTRTAAWVSKNTVANAAHYAV